ncbi:aminoglycoside phosphotransferase [Phyllobacterium salinisoli]|uniref:Aminoglycoside phosphotransferase n=1 Tax=Phyllobacterium salinisoli TaxID=1899321 RepID=A0A368K4R4_9HYPH|nr:aminoglycoside phosphotransferase family protein [Phyllobacterium salinisoli]RCS24377.1 aminoglycoside phosphotransferase [Phyllobacterium salinisoli]
MPNNDNTAAPRIDAALVRRLIAAQFPQWSDLPIKMVEPGGWDNRTFRLGDTMTVRLPSAAGYAAQVAKEHRWLPLLAPQLPLPIPRPLAQGAPDADYPWPWSIYRWLDGEPASDFRIGDFVGFARALAGFLAALYRIDVDPDAPPPGAHNFHRGGDLNVYDRETRAALVTMKGRMDTIVAEEIWTDALASIWQRAPVWVHGDVSWGNLLVEHGKLCAVIDFGSSAVGDPASDLVIAWTLFSGESRETFRNTLSLDDDTWARARGWALWKALIVVAGQDKNQREVEKSRQVIDTLLDEHRATRSI